MQKMSEELKNEIADELRIVMSLREEAETAKRMTEELLREWDEVRNRILRYARRSEDEPTAETPAGAGERCSPQNGQENY